MKKVCKVTKHKFTPKGVILYISNTVSERGDCSLVVDKPQHNVPADQSENTIFLEGVAS